jgi:hypothetical protein
VIETEALFVVLAGVREMAAPRGEIAVLKAAEVEAAAIVAAAREGA